MNIELNFNHLLLCIIIVRIDKRFRYEEYFLSSLALYNTVTPLLSFKS